MGSHTHETTVGVNVHIFRRSGKYIARGRYNREIFGETLGADERQATSRLRQLLTQIEDGTYVRPTAARKRPLPARQVPHLSLYELCNDFLTEKRRLRGKATAQNYRSRLAPVLEFTDLAKTRQRWPLAADVDRNFVLELRTFMLNRQVTRNGRGGVKKNMSERQIINCLETLRTALNWACHIQIRKLPSDFISPLTSELVGSPPAKDPLRQNVLQIERRVGLVQLMDEWQILHLSPLLVLPLRHEDLAGMLISDVDWKECKVQIGTRFGGADFTKAGTTIQLPIVKELMPVLNACRDGRTDGPLFRRRTVWTGQRHARVRGETRDEIENQVQRRLAAAPPLEIQSANDQKRYVRELIRDLGGVTEDDIGGELKELYRAIDLATIRPYERRAAVTSDMHDAGVRHLELRYLTEHSVKDILNDYTGIDPAGEIAKYYKYVAPLLDAVLRRAAELGVLPGQRPAA